MALNRVALLPIAAVLVSVPVAAWSADFSTDFEMANQRSVGCFEIMDGGLTATFAGGTAFTIGNAALYRSGDVSWMVDPAGDQGARGTSDGMGTLTLAEPAQSLSAWVRNETAATMARIRALDTTGGVIAESSAFSETDWTEFAPSVADGAALIEVVELINDGGGGMTALDDLAFQTPGAAAGTPGACPQGGSGGGGGAPGGTGDEGGYSDPGSPGGGGGGSGGGALAPAMLFGLAIGALLSRRRRALPRRR